jgi:autotransporter-associated beta strand protein
LRSGSVIDGTLTVTGGNWTGVGAVGGVVTSSSGTFTLDAGADLTASAGLALTGGTLAGTGTLTGSLTDTSITSETFGGVIAGANSAVTMNKAASTLTLTGVNTFAKGTTITAGTLQVGDGTSSTSLGAGAITIAAAGTLTTDLASTGILANAIIDNGHVVATGTGNNYNISGLISGTGNLTKTGINTVTISAANTYKGGTTVSGGTLLVDNTANSGTGTGAVTINSGGTLGGTGIITGATTLNSGGTLFPSAGTAAGAVLHEGSLLWNGGGTLTLQLSDTMDDALVLSGAMTKGSAGTYTLDLLNAGLVSTNNYNLTLITFASTTFTAANFNVELPTNYTGQLVVASTSLEIENLTDPPPGMSDEPVAQAELPAAGTEGSDLSTPSNLTPTPEPGSTFLLAFGGAALLGWRRRRR